jgi:cell division protein FtsB
LLNLAPLSWPPCARPGGNRTLALLGSLKSRAHQSRRSGLHRTRALRAFRSHFACGLLACVAAIGCKSQPHVNAHIESVNAEYRQLEDYVYALEEQNAKLQQELDAARQLAASGALPGAGATPPRGGLFRRGSSGRIPGSPSDRSAPSMESPLIELPGNPPATSPTPRSTFRQPELPSAEFSLPADTPPIIDPPRPAAERASPPAAEDALPSPTVPSDVAPQTPPERLPNKPTDTKITHLFLNPALTGGRDFDGLPGDDGLKIVIEPRNAADEFIPEAGSLSLVLLDPERQGDAARIARWDFDLEAARQILADSDSGRGFKLEMPWPAAAPTANRLRLFVRYETPDGRRVQTDRDIYVSPPGQSLSRWTPRGGEDQISAEVRPAAKIDAASGGKSADQP